MRLIVRKERPYPGAQLRFTDADGMRLTCFATNTRNVPIAALELRHRQRARAEDRIRAARATGLRNLPLHDAAQNRIWLEIVQIALDLLACLDADARPRRPGPPVGTPPPAAAAALRSRSARHHRTPPHPPRQALALDPGDHRRPATARSLAEPRLTSNIPSLRAAPPDRSRGTRRPPDATAGPPACPPTDLSAPNGPKGSVSKLTDPHARSVNLL
jgi:Transposase DDE domain group 1